MKAEVKDLTTDADIDAALEEAKLQPERPRAISAEYDAGLDIVVLRSDMGHHLVIPRKEIQGLENGTEAQLSKIDIYCGADIDWPELGVNHYFEHLLEGKYASEKWKKVRQEQGVAA
jgi:hypothetical protein